MANAPHANDITDAFALPDAPGQDTHPKAPPEASPREPAPFPGVGNESEPSAEPPAAEPDLAFPDPPPAEDPTEQPASKPVSPPADEQPSTGRATPEPATREQLPPVEAPPAKESPTREIASTREAPTPAAEAPAPEAGAETEPATPAAEPKSDPPTTSEPEAKPAEEPDRTEEPEPTNTAQPARRVPPIGIAGSLRPRSPATRPLNSTQQYLRRRLRSVLSYYYRRPLNSVDHHPWEVMHSMLSYGLHSRIIDRSAGSKPVTAIGFLCFNKPCQGKRLLRLGSDGRLDPEVAYGVQGHHGQFLAMLAQCNVSADYPVRVEDKKLTIHDLIEYEKRTCRAETELSFKLISLAHYLDHNERWVAEDGNTWSVSRLIEEERNQKIRGAACGGTHRLAGLSLAYRIRHARGEPLDGEFLAAKRFTNEYMQLAYRLQNRDGSLSTEWFRGRGEEEDINRRIRTTGHLLEWMLYTLPDERLTQPQTVRAVNYLTSLLAANTDNAWEIGPLGHALHALLLYDERVFQPHDDPAKVAYRTSKSRRGPTKLAYQAVTSRVYGTMPSSREAEKLREEAAAPGGLRGLFGIGRNGGRRSR